MDRLKLLATAFRPDQFPPPRGMEVILAGRSNVGKSSLVNQLAGVPPKERPKQGAKVSSLPGCTRSVNFFNLWPGVILVDLPGFGYAALPEKVRREAGALIEHYLQNRPNIGLIIHVVDVRHPLQALDWQMLEWGRHFHYPYLLTLNKCDKLSRSLIDQHRRQILESLQAWGWQPEIVAASALKGMGIPEIKKKLREKQAAFHPSA